MSLSTSLPIHDDVPRSEQLADILKALGHPLRLRIVSLLVDKEHHVNDLAELLGAPQAIVSQQLRILRMAALVEASRTNGHAYYRLAEPHLKDMLGCMSRCHTRAARPAVTEEEEPTLTFTASEQTT